MKTEKTQLPDLQSAPGARRDCILAENSSTMTNQVGDASFSGSNCDRAFAEDSPNLRSNQNCVRGIAVNAECIALQIKPRTIDRQDVSGFGN